MDSPESDEKIIRLLLTRLERISVDSYWAHRASGVRGALIRIMEEAEAKKFPNPEALARLYEMGFYLLERAAKEKH